MRIMLVAALALVATKAEAQGPGEGGAVLKDPYGSAKPAAPATYAEGLLNPAAAPAAPAPVFGQRQLQALEEKPDINKDIQVTRELGPWMIMVQCYTGPEAPIMARQMVSELRGGYKLPAYTFNYGSEERRKEYQRVKALVEKQREYFTKNGLTPDHIRIRTMRIEEQVGVLIGGYASDEEARRDLVNRIRNLRPLDPSKVMLDKRVVFEEDRKKPNPKAVKKDEGYVNPFLGAFVAHNPVIKHERPADWDKLDMKLLYKLNASESFNLLNCKKPFTLAVKHFQTPTVLETKTTPGSFLEKFRMAGKGERVDAAATSAHNLAELLHKAKLDAYVLHTKYTSIVTVGGYDSADDPAMLSMSQLIETKVMPQLAPLFATQPNQSIVQSKVVPMQVPR